MSRVSKLCFVSAGLALAVLVVDRAHSAEPPPSGNRQLTVKSPAERSSYAVGVTIGRSLKSDGLQAIPELIAQGLVDVLRGKPLQMNDADVAATMESLQRQMQAQQNAQSKTETTKNRQAAKAFLAANQKKPGVVTLPKGLQYQVLRAGTGPSPAATNTVKVHYHGTLIGGQVFDSSVQRGEPIEFPLNRVIPGWTEAVTRMKVGGKWRLFIPPDLAYGDNPPRGSAIGPGMLLIFDVELLQIVK